MLAEPPFLLPGPQNNINKTKTTYTSRRTAWTPPHTAQNFVHSHVVSALVLQVTCRAVNISPPEYSLHTEPITWLGSYSRHQILELASAS